jgi:hypothetical protein
MVDGCVRDWVSVLVAPGGNVRELVGKDMVCFGVMRFCGSCCCSGYGWDQGWGLCGWSQGSQGGSDQFGMPVVGGIVGQEAVPVVVGTAGQGAVPRGTGR